MKNSENPLVSIVMPVFNGEMYVTASIDSMLTQSYQNFELIIINDGSTDRSVTLIEKYRDPRIRLVHNDRNLTLVPSLNKGLALARGQYIARMDCDDISLPQRLEVQVQYLEHHPDVAVCGTWAETFGASRKKWRFLVDAERVKAGLAVDCVFVHSSVMIRKSVLDQNQLTYDPAYIHSEDFDLWQRISISAKLVNLPKILHRYRLSATSTSRLYQVEQKKSIIKLYARTLERLQIPLSNQELDLFYSICRFQPIKEPDWIYTARDILLKVIQANHALHIFPEPYFSRIMGHRWIWQQVYWLKKNSILTLRSFSIILIKYGFSSMIDNLVFRIKYGTGH